MGVWLPAAEGQSQAEGPAAPATERESDAHEDTVLPQAYECKEAILALFRESEDKDAARTRRDAILEQFGGVLELKKMLNVIRGNDFEQMIVYLDYENLDKTNNNAEREDRVYQKGEKVRYRARKSHTRLNYVSPRARQRDQRSAERNDHSRRRKKRRVAFAGWVDAVVEWEARRLTAWRVSKSIHIEKLLERVVDQRCAG